MKNSKISWTKHTFNPWEGCTEVSPGCANCYAKSERCDRYRVVGWGPSADRRRVTTTTTAPLKWHEEAIRAGRRDKVFCASLWSPQPTGRRPARTQDSSLNRQMPTSSL